MAELISNPKGKGSKRLSTRIDLTPMVDLGFLLITFFIFTTTLMKPSTMEVQMPDDTPSPNPTEIPHHVAMKVFLGREHKIYYLTGIDAMNNNMNALKEVSFGGEYSIREAFVKHIASIHEAFANHLPGSRADDKPFILIKASTNSQYLDLVDMLDELQIAGISQYALMDLDAKESDMIAKL